MIPSTQHLPQLLPKKSLWQQLLREAIRDPKQLLTELGLADEALRISPVAATQFPLKVPRGFVARMRYGDRNDPLLRQVLPLVDEERVVPGFDTDAVGDGVARRASGVIQKYSGRALLIATGSCAIHCRYCFRRHFPYSEETAAANQWSQALTALNFDTSINEVILSGGDPLSLGTAKLKSLTDQLQSLKHIKRLRIHTRLPIVLPERIDDELLAWLGDIPLQKVIVVHANHGNEIDSQITKVLLDLKFADVSMLNQTVLLAGVNDDAACLAELSERLFESGTLPYYLHQLDRVTGTAHFEVDQQRALVIYRELLAKLPGFLVPKLVKEIVGAASKLPLNG